MSSWAKAYFDNLQRDAVEYYSLFPYHKIGRQELHRYMKRIEGLCDLGFSIDEAHNINRHDRN